MHSAAVSVYYPNCTYLYPGLQTQASIEALLASDVLNSGHLNSVLLTQYEFAGQRMHVGMPWAMMLVFL